MCVDTSVDIYVDTAVDMCVDTTADIYNFILKIIYYKYLLKGNWIMIVKKH